MKEPSIFKAKMRISTVNITNMCVNDELRSTLWFMLPTGYRNHFNG